MQASEFELLAPPACEALLKDLRLRAVAEQRRGAAGRHLMRQRGQSLEFREYEAYQPGHDVRYVDWRASLRQGDPQDWVVRSFVAEEDLTIVVSIDTRASMWMPGGGSKVQVAAWLAWAIGRIGLASGDTLIVHRLFGPARSGHRRFSGSAARDGLWPGIRSVVGSGPVADEAAPNVKGLDRLLPPASVWIVLSDFYLRVEANKGLANAMLRARDGSRWVVHGDMDSWPHEVALLGKGARRIEGPGAEEELECEIHEASLGAVEAAIEANKRGWRERVRARGSDRMHWLWPAEAEVDAGLFFKEQLAGDGVIRRLFMRRGEGES